MSAIGIITIEQATSGAVLDDRNREAMPGGLALSAALHVGLVLMIVFGLPNLFAPPPPQETPIAVDLVTIAPETKATHPNPFRPKREAKPEPAIAPPAPKPKPEPPKQPTAAEPPSSAPPPAPSPSTAAKPEAKEPPPPPPPPKPVETTAPRPPEPKPRVERPQVHDTPRPEAKPTDPRAFAKLLDRLQDRKPEPHPQPQPAFDALLKNLTRQQTAEAEDAPPAPQKMAAAAAPSSQPHAPLGSELTASQKDLIIQQIERCWDVPAGARDAQDLVVEIKAVVNADGTVSQAAVVDGGRYASDPFFRAAADSAKRAVLNPQCTGPASPLPVPPDKYEVWRNLDLFFNPKDLL